MSLSPMLTLGVNVGPSKEMGSLTIPLIKGVVVILMLFFVIMALMTSPILFMVRLALDHWLL